MSNANYNLFAHKLDCCTNIAILVSESLWQSSVFENAVRRVAFDGIPWDNNAFVGHRGSPDFV
jgi:hypothetical protein